MSADDESRDSTPSDGLSGTLSPAPSHGDANGSDASNGFNGPSSPSSPIQVKPGNKDEQQFIKRPLNAYMMWTVENRQRIVAENPTMKMNDISKLMGELWKGLTDDERKPFFEKAVKSKMEHKQVLKENPNYVYQPLKKKPKKEADLNASSSTASSSVPTTPVSHHHPTPLSVRLNGGPAPSPMPAAPAATPYLQQRLNGGPSSHAPPMSSHHQGTPSSSNSLIAQALGVRQPQYGTPHAPPPQQRPPTYQTPQAPPPQRPPTMHAMLDMYYVSLCQPAFPEPGEPGLTQMPPQYYFDQYQQMHYQQMYSQHHHEQQILQHHGMSY